MGYWKTGVLKIFTISCYGQNENIFTRTLLTVSSLLILQKFCFYRYYHFIYITTKMHGAHIKHAWWPKISGQTATKFTAFILKMQYIIKKV